MTRLWATVDPGPHLPGSMPRAERWIIDPTPDGFFLLLRYTTGMEFGGDTWHETVEHAREQAASEYGDALGGWRTVPAEVEDAVAFAARSN